MTAYDDIKEAILQAEVLTGPQVQELINLLADGDFDTLFPPKVRRAEHSNRGKWREWASSDKVVRSLPEDHQYTSWLIWHHAGIAPYGSKKSWAAAVTDLLEAAGGRMELVGEAIKKGKEARMGGITLKGPRSFIGWARDLRGRRELERIEQATLIDLDDMEDGREGRISRIDVP